MPRVPFFCAKLILQGRNHTLEDHIEIDNSKCVFAVADGVSRPIYGIDAICESGRVKTVAAKFCNIAKDALAAGDSVESIAPLVTADLAAYNAEFGFVFPYTGDDLDPYASIGVAGRIGEGGILDFGFIGDVGLKILSAQGEVVTLTEDQLRPTRAFLDRERFQTAKERKRVLRALLRNNLSTVDSDGHLCGYGVFNGDPRANRFWSVGCRTLLKGDILVAHTDGANGIVGSPDFPEFILSILRDGSLVDASDALNRYVQQMINRSAPTIFEDDLSIVIGVYNP